MLDAAQCIHHAIGPNISIHETKRCRALQRINGSLEPIERGIESLEYLRGAGNHARESEQFRGLIAT